MDQFNQDEFVDKMKVCIECDEVFVFEVGEQKFFAKMGMLDPKRCPACRKRRKKPITRIVREARDAKS